MGTEKISEIQRNGAAARDSIFTRVAALTRG